MRMKFLILAILLLPVSVSASESLSSLISDARVMALDTGTGSRTRFSDAQITTFINQGQSEMMAESHCLMGSKTFQLTIGTTYYAMPSNFYNVARVTIGGKEIQQLSPAALDGRSLGWELSSGYPTYFYINFSSRDYVGFAPFPDASSDTDTIKIDYYQQAGNLVNNGDIPFNGELELQDYDHALAYFAAALMDQVDGLYTASNSYMAIFTAMSASMKKECYNEPDYLPSATASP